MSSLDLYNKIGDVSDIQLTLSDTEDGESHYVEFKQVRHDLNVASKADTGDFKLDIAKEMSAFANTDSGIIVLGYDGKDRNVVNATSNLQDWVDRNFSDMLEPKLSGVMVKTIGDTDKLVVMYIPKGKAIPYRVASVGSCSPKRRANVREYYQRIGTSSVPIPEPIVRTMYRSSDSALDIEIFPQIIEAREHLHESKSGRGYIRLGLYVKPDQTRLIEKYYLSSSAVLLNSDFRALSGETIVINEASLKDSVIPPTDSLFQLNSIDIRSAINTKQPSYMPISTENLDFNGNTETVSSNLFNNIYAIHVRTEYACDGMPMRRDERIIIIGDKRTIGKDTWREESYWIDERCRVVQYVSFSPDNDNLGVMYAMEHYIRSEINHE